MTVNGWLHPRLLRAADHPLADPRPLLCQGLRGARLPHGSWRSRRLLLRCFFVDPKREQDGSLRKELISSRSGWIILYWSCARRVFSRGTTTPGWSSTRRRGMYIQHGFVVPTNTNWQYYGAKTTLTYLSQISG